MSASRPLHHHDRFGPERRSNTQSPRVVALILAAGAGRRMGGPKALVRLGGGSFLSEVIGRITRPGVLEVIVVLGHGASRIIPTLPSGVGHVVNPRPDDGMLGSVLLGLEAAEGAGATAALLHPVDHPLVAPETVDRVIAALGDGARIAVPSHAERRGHPGGFARATWPALRAAPPEHGARSVLAAHPDWIVHVEGDPGCRAGIDTRADYERLVGPWPSDPWIA